MKPVVAVLLLTVVGAVAYTQVPPPALPVPVEAQLPAAAVAPVPPQPIEPAVEVLLSELEHVQGQKVALDEEEKAFLRNIQARRAALEKREKEVGEAARKKLEQHGERLKKLGVAPGPAAGDGGDRVGRIIIKGNDGEDDKKILAAAKDLRPGQVLTYPAVAEVEKRLQKAGYPDARVTVEPNKDDSPFKDVVIWVGK